MLKITIPYHSGYGHTEKVAYHVSTGAKRHANVSLINVTDMSEENWALLDQSHAIIFGSPTYMGGVSAQYKHFIDKASVRWFKQVWRDKIAAGFTNSGSLSGDKLSTLQQLSINALQHGMIWVGQVEMAPSLVGEQTAPVESINRIGSYLGLMTQSNNDSSDVTPPKGDLLTAELFGERVALITKKFYS